MPTLQNTLQRLIAIKHMASTLETRFLRQLTKLPALRGSARSGTAPGRIARRTLKCPRCARRFAYPLHLGRHLSATHGRRRRKAA